MTGFDLERRVVHTAALPGETGEYPYDSLIVAAGAGQSYFGHDEFAMIAPGMKTIDDAMELRRRVYGALEIAETCSDPALAAVLDDLRHRRRRADGRRAGRADPRARLPQPHQATSATSIPPPSGSSWSTVARSRWPTSATSSRAGPAPTLEKMGVELRMGLRVVGVDPFGVDTEGADGDKGRFECGTTIWAAGRPGLAAGRPAGRGHRSRDRPRRQDRRAARSQPARAPRGLRRRRHGRPSTTCPASARWPCRAACTPPTRSSGD